MKINLQPERDWLSRVEAAAALERLADAIPPASSEPPAVGDGYDIEPLLTAEQVGEILGLPTKSIYELGGLPRVTLGPRRVRWRPADVRTFILERTEEF